MYWNNQFQYECDGQVQFGTSFAVFRSSILYHLLTTTNITFLTVVSFRIILLILIKIKLF